MDCFSAWVLFLLVFGLGWWIRGVSTRTGAVQTRLRQLEAEVGELRGAFDRMAAGGETDSGSSPAVPETVVLEDAVVLEETVEPLAVDRSQSARAEATPAPPAAAMQPAVSPELLSPEPGELLPIPPRRVDWERWLGVRGAALLGAAALALAGLLFLKFSIERGLIPPPVRVVIGLLAGLAAIAGSEILRRRSDLYRTTANALAGGGVVLLYGAVWAARSLYDLIPGLLAFLLMALVTAACGALSWRYGSRVIASLGLVGGFATPALLSTGADRPIALFGYLLLLDAGLLFLAARRGWPGLAALSLGITGLYQAFWIFGRMGDERTLLGLGILALFAVVYAVSSTVFDQNRAGASAGVAPSRPTWLLTEAGGVLLPFAFALHVADRAVPESRLYPLALLLLLLSVLALWLGRAWQRPFPGLAAAAGAVAVVTSWSVQTELTPPLAWELVICALGLALAFHLFFERQPVPAGRDRAALVAAGGFFLLLILLPLELGEDLFWSWLAGWLGLAALLWRQGTWHLETGCLETGRVETGGQSSPRRWLAALGLGLAFGLYTATHGGSWPVLWCALAVAAGLQMLARLDRDSGSAAPPLARSHAAAATMPLLMLLFLLDVAGSPDLASATFPAVALGLGLLVVLAATRLGSGIWTLAAVLATALVHLVWSSAAADPGAGLVIQGLAVLVFTAWPFFAGEGLWRDLWAWRAAALAGPVWFPSLRTLFESRFGDAAIGLVPLALGALSLAAVLLVRRTWPAEHAPGKSRLAWFAAAALGFVSVAIPLQLDKEWITVGWALQGFAVIALWRRLNHPGLKFFGLALLAAATLRLVANPALLGYYPRGGWPVLNWLLYTYLVPAAALVGSALYLFRLEAVRYLPWESRLYRQQPIGAVACGLAAILVVFVWINLTIFDLFSSGRLLQVSFDRLPARDLTMSLAWVAYALVLLGLGMVRSSRGLRWISLGFLILAIGKVFLYDLGELEDLYRVASLLGLALSLILVSLAYQRFVFDQRAP